MLKTLLLIPLHTPRQVDTVVPEADQPIPAYLLRSKNAKQPKRITIDLS